jgi:hypothetical protein
MVRSTTSLCHFIDGNKYSPWFDRLPALATPMSEKLATCKLYVTRKQNVCLNSASASFLVIRLAARWLDVQRDLDADGWQQLRIDPSSLAALDAEAPPDAAAFAEYAVRIAGHRDTYFDEQEWIEIRDFVRGAAAARHPVVCSY